MRGVVCGHIAQGSRPAAPGDALMRDRPAAPGSLERIYNFTNFQPAELSNFTRRGACGAKGPAASRHNAQGAAGGPVVPAGRRNGIRRKHGARRAHIARPGAHPGAIPARARARAGRPAAGSPSLPRAWSA